MRKYTIILDAAHGVETPGKRSPDGKFREYRWSRDIIRQLKRALEQNGFKVAESNTTENEIGLTRRANNANAVKANKRIFISIHANAASNGQWSKARGYSVYTTKGRTNSDKVAEQILQDMRKNFPELRGRFDMSDGDLDQEENFTVIYKAKMPAVLVEWLFQDNKEDVALLMNPTYNSRLVNSLVESIIKLDTSL